MPGFLATVNSSVVCSHMGKSLPMTLKPRPSQERIDA